MLDFFFFFFFLKAVLSESKVLISCIYSGCLLFMLLFFLDTRDSDLAELLKA